MSGRYEYKYRIDARQEALLYAKAAAVLLPDPHTDAHGAYIVRSLYLDDVFDSCLQDNLRGADPRAKFRIRRYGDDAAFLRLEKKIKRAGLGEKVSCRITPKECRAILAGEIPLATADMEPLKQQLLTEACVRGLLPKIVVTYVRRPLIYPAGNVRVAFDSALTASDETDRFLTQTYAQRPVLPPGETIMEVKWTGFLPAHVRGVLQHERLVWSAFSKYTACRLTGR